MSKEIELKAHVYDWHATLNRLRASSYTCDEKFEEKEDVYFFNPLTNQSFRTRREVLKDSNGKYYKNTILTVKEKVVEEGIEKNREIEVDLPYENFESSIVFFEALGFKQTIKKTKAGYSFSFNYFEYPLHIELLKVNKLGWFFEIEFIVDEDVKNEVITTLVHYLYKTLDMFEIPHSEIEKKYYSELLVES